MTLSNSTRKKNKIKSSGGVWACVSGNSSRNSNFGFPSPLPEMIQRGSTSMQASFYCTTSTSCTIRLYLVICLPE